MLLVLSAQTFGARGESIQERVLALVNDFRNEQQRAPLESEARLASAAQAFAEHLAATGRFEHNADGTTPRARAKERGYDACVIAENIAYEYSSRGFTTEQLARQFVQGWKESATHRENLMWAAFSDTGIGVARARDGGYYAVQMFGAPRVAGKRCPRLN